MMTQAIAVTLAATFLVPAVSRADGLHFHFPHLGPPPTTPPPVFIPADSKELRCQALIAKHVGRLMSCMTACYTKAADRAFRGKAFDKMTCDESCRARYDTTAARVSGCPACSGRAERADLANEAVAMAGRVDANAYCQPVGFVP